MSEGEARGWGKGIPIESEYLEYKRPRYINAGVEMAHT